MTLPQNGAKAAREYCACGAEASQNDGVTTVTKFHPMPIKYSALQRANLALQPRLQLDSLVVAHAISASRGTKSFFHDGRGFVRVTAVLALHRRCFPAKEIARENKLPARTRSNPPGAPSQDGALSQEVRQRKNNIRLRSIARAREAVSRARPDDGRNRCCDLGQASAYISVTFSGLPHNPLVYFIRIQYARHRAIVCICRIVPELTRYEVLFFAGFGIDS